MFDKKMYDAMMQAADHIEKNPESYRFQSVTTPDGGPGTKACMLGWFGHYYGLPKDEHINRPAKILGLASHGRFYPLKVEHHNVMGLQLPIYIEDPKYQGFMKDPRVAAKLMRDFAEEKLAA